MTFRRFAILLIAALVIINCGPGGITEAALDWLDQRREAPFLLFVHYFDVHLSYSPPAPYDTLFDPDYCGPMGRSFDLDYFSSREVPEMRSEISALSPADINHIVALYERLLL